MIIQARSHLGAPWWHAVVIAHSSSQRTKAVISLEFGRHRGRPRRIQQKHHDLVQIGRTAAEDFHRHIGSMADQGLTGVRVAHAVRRFLTDLAGEYVERLGARM